MTIAIDVLEKIHSEKLRHQAEVGAAMPQTVLVEVKVPRPVIGRSERASITPGRSMLRVEPQSLSGSNAVVEKTRDLISKIVGRTPKRYLSSSHAFIIDATGAQLRDLAKIPSIQAIWPNTHRR